MEHTKDLTDIVCLALCSAYVKGNRPLSLLIISDRPESGKTEIVKEFIGTPGIEFCTDVSSYGLRRDFPNKIARGEVRHIIIPELLQPLMKGKAQSQQFVQTLGTFMEDGVMGFHSGFLPSSTLGEETNVNEIRTVGIIGCMPKYAYTASMKREWAMLGFLSRLLLVTYKYNDQAIQCILDNIRKGKYLKPKGRGLNLDGEMIDVSIPDDVAVKCELLGLEITKCARENNELYGFREIKHIRSLVMANVVYDRVRDGVKRKDANMDDFNKIESLGYLFNEQFNAVRQ